MPRTFIGATGAARRKTTDSVRVVLIEGKNVRPKVTSRKQSAGAVQVVEVTRLKTSRDLRRALRLRKPEEYKIHKLLAPSPEVDLSKTR